jgi:hypothetical protein
MDITKVAIALAICYGAVKFAPNPSVKAGAISIAAVIVGKQIPYVKELLA